MTIAQQIGEMVEQMPENRQVLILEMVKIMLAPDDFLSDEDIEDIARARREFAHGGGINHDDIDWD